MKKVFAILLSLLLSGCSNFDIGGKKPYKQYHPRTSTPPLTPSPLTANQKNILIVRRKKYKKQALLNSSEQALFWKLLKITNKCNVRIFPQANFGEFLSCNETDANKEGYYAMQSKRADFCITDKNFNPIMAVEFNGSGHYGNDYQNRDEIKKIVTASAGIQYVAITPQNEKEQLFFIEDYLQN